MLSFQSKNKASFLILSEEEDQVEESKEAGPRDGHSSVVVEDKIIPESVSARAPADNDSDKDEMIDLNDQEDDYGFNSVKFISLEFPKVTQKQVDEWKAKEEQMRALSELEQRRRCTLHSALWPLKKTSRTLSIFVSDR